MCQQVIWQREDKERHKSEQKLFHRRLMSRMTRTEVIRLKLDLSLPAWMTPMNEGNRPEVGNLWSVGHIQSIGSDPQGNSEKQKRKKSLCNNYLFLQ